MVKKMNSDLSNECEYEYGYPEPTVITIDENTDMSKMHESAIILDENSPKIRRVLIGMKIFGGELDFQEWQKQEPREIFEITPTAVLRDGHSSPIPVIFVTYAAGFIE